MMSPRRLYRAIREAALMMVGQTPYETYSAHMTKRHPNTPVMSEVAFFRHRQEARYSGSAGGRCC